MNNPYLTRNCKLNNGLEIFAVGFPGIKTVSIRCFVFTGSAYENRDNNGISHFLEHTLFRGNAELGDSNAVNLKMEELGGELNAVTSFDLTELWLDYHIDYLDRGIERFCQFLRFPQFNQIEIERAIIIEEIQADYGDENKLIDLDSLIAESMWPEHPMRFPVTGSARSIQNISQSDLSAWFHEYYQPGNMIIGITGDFDPEYAIGRISGRFADCERSFRKKYQPIEEPKAIGEQIKLVNQKDNQFNLLWSFPNYPLNPELRIQLQLIRRILDDGSSSRLQQIVREERGLVYDISAEMLYFDSGATLNIQSQVSVNRFQELMQTLTSLVGELQQNGVSESELELAKLRSRISIDFNNDTAYGILNSQLSSAIQPYILSINQTRSIIDGMNVGRINKTLSALLNQRNSCFVAVGPCENSHQEMLEGILADWIQMK